MRWNTYIALKKLLESINYGRIYKGYIVNDVRGFCPLGWSFPTVAQIDALRLFLQPGSTPTANVVGRFLKESGTEFWVTGNDADNSALFYGRGAGTFQASGVPINFKQQVNFWGITASGTLRRCMSLSSSAGMTRPFFDITTGNCIRLIKNDSIDPGTMAGNDGTVYRTVTIGGQVWMAESSKESRFSNGDLIPIVSNATDFAASMVSCMAAPNYDDSLI